MGDNRDVSDVVRLFFIHFLVSMAIKNKIKKRTYQDRKRRLPGATCTCVRGWRRILTGSLATRSTEGGCWHGSNTLLGDANACCTSKGGPLLLFSFIIYFLVAMEMEKKTHHWEETRTIARRGKWRHQMRSC